MTEKKKLSKRGLIFIETLMLLGGIYSWLDYFYNFIPDKGVRPGGKLFLAIVMTSLSVIFIMEILRFGKDRKIYHYIAYIFAIPLIPLFIVGLLSQTRLLASLTLPLMVLGILISISTYSFHQLELLQEPRQCQSPLIFELYGARKHWNNNRCSYGKLLVS